MLGFSVAAALADGALLHKSGPIQVSSDGQFVWLVNRDHDSVSRLRTSDDAVSQFPLPDLGVRHGPQGIALLPDGSQVWVAACDSDHIFVLDGASGAVLTSIAVRHGGGPISVAISPDGTRAVVALHYAAELLVFDTATRTLVGAVDGLFRRPFGLTFTRTPDELWVSHRHSDVEVAHVSGIDLARMEIKAHFVLKSVDPKNVSDIPNDPDPIPEGGYLHTIGHLAQPPSLNQVWLPTQYQNLHPDVFSPNGTVQAALHKIDLPTGTPSASRTVLTAVYAHNGRVLLGDGWNAHISGPVDLAFSADGSTAYMLSTYSNDVVVFPTDVGMVRLPGVQPLREIAVGNQPIGIAASPVAETAYVLNHLSRTVSVVDLRTLTELRQIAVTPGTPDPLPANILRVAKLFNSAADPRMSSGKVSCASCHTGGEADSLAWNLAPLGAGMRKTLSLRGLALSFGPRVGDRGQLHRSGDRDEIQDFDFTARGPSMGGTGILPAPNPPLGAANAGLDPDLDALASYALSLPAIPRSPHRAADGALDEAAVRGAAIFKNTSGGPFDVGCIQCHRSPNFTDLGFHDVGGHAPEPENEGPDFNTPSLVGAWALPPYLQGSGVPADSASLGGFVRTARSGVHGDTSGLDRLQMRDLETFLNSIDGDLARSGLDTVVDLDRPRVVALLPVSLNAVEIVFSESVDSATARDPANYALNDGARDFVPTAVVVNPEWSNRVRLAIGLEYPSCPVTYTLRVGPIEDLAGRIGGGANNVLDVNDPSNWLSFVIDGTITVSFGGSGMETFPDVARDAAMAPNRPTSSLAHWLLSPVANPENKGFVAFDFLQTLLSDCGVTDSNDILDARFSAVSSLGHRSAIELRRCLMPWDEPPHDWCAECPVSVTARDSSYPNVRWHQSGARALGGAGTSVPEYYPTGTFDLAARVDATAEAIGISKRVEFAGPLVTDAFRFWYDHPAVNYGYGVEIVGNNGTSLEFWETGQEDGHYGIVLSITFAVQPNVAASDPCDANCDGVLNGFDIEPFIAVLIDGEAPCSACAADVNGDGVRDAFDIEPFIACLFAP